VPPKIIKKNTYKLDGRFPKLDEAIRKFCSRTERNEEHTNEKVDILKMQLGETFKKC